MRVDDTHLDSIILILSGHAGDAFAAAMLGLIRTGGNAFDVAGTCQGDNHIFLGDQVLHINLTFNGRELRAAVICKLVTDSKDFILDDFHEKLTVGKDGLKVCDGLFEFLVFFQQTVSFQSGETGKTHIKDCLGLLLCEFESLHEAGLRSGCIRRITDECDNFINMIQSLEKTFQNMGTCLCFVEIEFGTPCNNVLLMLEIIVDDVTEVQDTGFAVHEGKHVGTEGFLKRSVFVQEIQDNLRINILFQLDNDTHAVSVGFITDVGYSFNPLVTYKIGNFADQCGFVDHVGDFSDDDTAAAVPHIFDF